MSPYPKAVVQTFENFAKSQLTFIQNITELAAKPTYVDCLYENNVVDIVLSLVTNRNPTVRMNAVLSLARLAGNSELCAKQILCSKDLLFRVFEQIVKENKYYKKNCMHLIKSLSKYSAINSKTMIKDCGGLDALLTCTKDFDVYVREGALQAIAAIVRQDLSLSQYLINAGVLSQIIVCLKEQHQNLKLCALSVLDEMVKHSQELAQTIVEVPTLPHVMNYLSQNCTDIKVQRSALVLIKDIVKHSLSLTESAIESNLFPEILLLMAHPDESIRINSAKVICEIVKHSVQISQMVVNNGGIVSLINVISSSKEHPATTAVLALGYIAAMSQALALAVIQSEGLLHLTAILKSDVDKYTKAGAIWAIGMIGQHSSEHSRSVAASGALNSMMDIYINSNLESECKHKCRTALQLILNECDDYIVLESLLTTSASVEIMTFILNKMSKILPKNAKARRSFITNGLLKMIQNLNQDTNSEIFHVIQAVNCCFPEDIIQMVAGDFPEAVMKKVDKYVPPNQCLFENRQPKDEKVLSKSRSMNKPSLSGEESLFE